MATGRNTDIDDVPDLCESEEEVEDGDDDAWEEGEGEEVNPLQGAVKCLFSDHIEHSVESLLTHMKENFSFDLVEICRRHAIDCINFIKLINFIRDNNPKPSEILESLQLGSSNSDSVPWSHDSYMQPKDATDLLLQFDIESAMASIEVDTTLTSEGEVIDALSQRLRQELETQAVLREELARAMEEIECLRLSGQQMVLRMGTKNESNDRKKYNNNEKVKQTADINGDAFVHEEDGYFASYTHHDIHATMLKDSVRTESYRDFMLKNPKLFEGKSVLDVGCGTGILSMFAVQAGAAKVVAVDQSNIIYQAMDIARQNNLHDKITFVKGKLEDVSLPIEKFDIIVSEWMGYFLLFEAMLDSVLWARDHYLAPGGTVYPDHFSMHLVGVDDPDLIKAKVNFWDDVYGYKMSCMKTDVLKEICVRTVKGDCVVTEPALIKDISVSSVRIPDLEFSSSFSLKCIREASLSSIAAYFVTDFDYGCTHKVSFSTGPESTRTHWEQAVMLLPKALKVTDGQSIQGHITYRKHPHDTRGSLVTLKIQENTYKYHLS